MRIIQVMPCSEAWERLIVNDDDCEEDGSPAANRQAPTYDAFPVIAWGLSDHGFMVPITPQDADCGIGDLFSEDDLALRRCADGRVYGPSGQVYGDSSEWLEVERNNRAFIENVERTLASAAG